MRVLGISGSPRKGGNCEFIINHTLKAIAEEGVETEFLTLAGLTILPCRGCATCKKQERCIIEDDLMPVYEKMKAADGIILATPVYFGSVASLPKSLMDRAGYVSRNAGNTFKGKVGGPLVVARRGGMTFAFAQMNLWFHVLEFNMAGSTYWNFALGRDKGEVANDQEGLDTVWRFGKNVAHLVKALHS